MVQKFLEDAGFVHIKEGYAGLNHPMVYIFREVVSLNIQKVLSLHESPHFCVARNAQLSSGGDFITSLPGRKIIYTLYVLREEIKKIETIGGFEGLTTIKGRPRAVRIESSNSTLRTLEGVYVHRKYLG